MKKGYILFLFLWLASTGIILAQEVEYYKEESTLSPVTDSSAAEWVRPGSRIIHTSPSRFSYNLSMGSMVGFGGGGRGFATYMAPEVGYRVSDRFTLRTGVMVMNSTMPAMWIGDRGMNSMPGRSAIMYTAGSYMVNERVTLSGMAFYDMNTLAGQNRHPSMNPNASRGMAVGAEFRITEHFSIGAAFSTQRGGMQPFGAPVYNPSFNRMGGMMW